MIGFLWRLISHHHTAWACAAVIAALALAGCATPTEPEPSADTPPPAKPAEPAEPAAEEPPAEEPATIRLVKRKSFCETSPADARLYVYLTLRNTGTTEGTVGALPIRRYDDGTTNDSVLDVVEATVPAGKTKLFYAVFDYNAREHELIECSVKLDTGSGFGSPVELRVALPE